MGLFSLSNGYNWNKNLFKTYSVLNLGNSTKKGGSIMAFGAGVNGVACGPNFLPGIAIVVVIILLLVAMGIVF